MELHETKRITGKNAESEEKGANNELGAKEKVSFEEEGVLRVQTCFIQISKSKESFKT